MSDTAVSGGDDTLGAIGMPLGVVSVVLALVPGLMFVALPVLWVPGAAALILGIIGLRRNHGGRGPRTLSNVSIALGGIALAVMLGWLALWGLARLMTECMDVTVCS